jgi:hypothetical protein
VIETIFTTIVLPELSRWLQSRPAGAPFPTTAELTAQIQTIHDSIVTAGNNFLASKGLQPIVT